MKYAYTHTHTHLVEYIDPGQILINRLWPLLAFYFTSHHQLLENWLFIGFVLNFRFISSFLFVLSTLHSDIHFEKSK